MTTLVPAVLLFLAVSQVSCLYGGYGYGGYGGSRYKRSTDSHYLASHHGDPVVSTVPNTYSSMHQPTVSDTYSSVHQPTSVQVGNTAAPYFSTMQHSLHHPAPVEAMHHSTPVQVKDAPALHVSSPVLHVSGHISPIHIYTLPTSQKFYTHP